MLQSSLSADTELLEAAIEISREAGDAIMAVRAGGSGNAELKQDDSPVTGADRAAHQLICAALASLTPKLPVFSEEGEVPWQTRRSWQRYWLVDPLDGTREYLRGSAEFTVNIALIHDGAPVLGVIFQPITNIA